MKYDVYLMNRKPYPVTSKLNLEIPDNLTPDERIMFAAMKLMQRYRIELIPAGEDHEIRTDQNHLPGRKSYLHCHGCNYFVHHCRHCLSKLQN